MRTIASALATTAATTRARSRFLRAGCPAIMSVVVLFISVVASAQGPDKQTIEQRLASLTCDQSSADPLDPDKPPNVRGVERVIEPELTIYRCMGAMTTKAAHRRHAYQLGRALEATGDYKNARAFYLKAAESGSVIAMAHLSRLLNQGQGGPVDRGEAKRWHDAAEKSGNAAVRQVLRSLPK